MEQEFGKYPYDKETVDKIIKIVKSHPQARRIVLQYPKRFISESFKLTKYLRKVFSSKGQNQDKNNAEGQQQKLQKIQFYTLFDSMKKQCCTDIIGAEHVDYELLIHFGEACFSEQIKKNHYYLFETITKDVQQDVKTNLLNQKFIKSLKNNNIKYVLTQQNLYQYVKNYLSNKWNQSSVQILKLPYDAQQNDEYLIFGYFVNNKTKTHHQKQLNQAKQQIQTNISNILVLLSQHPESDNKLLSDLHLTVGSFSSNKSLFPSPPQIFITSLDNPVISPSTVNYSKSLMSRLTQIGQLQKHQTFGLLVSNVATKFCREAVQKCKQILEEHGKKYFIFMMNNLNEVKLGNFPQIQVYVVISCFNNSCFSMKQFCRLVVTPMDLQVAFNNTSITDYNFDLSYKPRNQSEVNEIQQNKQQQDTSEYKINKNQQNQVQRHSLALSIQQKQQLMLSQTLQSLDYYRGKQYKGLDFSEKKPIQKIKKGKIGLAQQYQPLPNTD